MLALSPELCGRIVEFSADRRPDLLSLCVTCKAFQREAEIRIYTDINLSEPAQASIACRTLASNERLAQYTKSFCFNQEYPPRRAQDINLGHAFWKSVQLALIAVCNLENLLISDPSYQNSWILVSPNIKFQLREVKLRFNWDEPVVRFLRTQASLRNLHFYYFDEIAHFIDPQDLPELRVFDGSLTIGMQLVQSSITHIQLVVDCDPGPSLSLFPRIGSLRKTLRGLSLLDLQDEISLPTLDIISRYLPNLRHLGLLPYPLVGVSGNYFSIKRSNMNDDSKSQRLEFIQYLMRMHCLETVELDVGRWIDRPTFTAGQRALASEIRTFCPTIKTVVIWISNTRYTWTHNKSQWESVAHTRQYPQLSNTWCLA